jgi:archaellum component FlaC
MLGEIENDVKEVSVRMIPVLENMEVITSKLRSITANVDDQMSIVRSSVQSLKEIADNVLEFERQVQDRIEAPVLEVAGILGSVVRGVAAFINRLRG